MAAAVGQGGRSVASFVTWRCTYGYALRWGVEGRGEKAVLQAVLESTHADVARDGAIEPQPAREKLRL